MSGNVWPRRVGDLLLRELQERDSEALLRFRNEPEVTRWLIRTQIEPEVFRHECRGVARNDRDFSCVAEWAGQIVAMGYLEVGDGVGQPGMPPGGEGTIGYIVDPGFAGRGFASGLARGLLAAAFEDLGLRRVTAGCFAANRASARVLEKAGMRREQHGVADSWHAELGWIEGYTYALLADEWREGQGG